MDIKKVFLALTRLEKILFIGALLVFSLALAVKLGLYVQANTKALPAEGGVFREGIVGQPVFINPVIPTTNADRDISKLIFGSLADVAETVKHSDDGKTWNVRLKQNVLWHDGERLTSDDVIFTINTIQDREARSPLFASFQGITADRISELSSVHPD